MRIELLVIGDELLTGQTNPYPTDMIKRVREIGAYLSRVSIVTDDVEVIVAEMAAAKGRGTDLLVVTGGLGPTIDDVTRHAVAKFLDVNLVIDPEAERSLKQAIQKMHGRRLKLSGEALLMAKVPAGSGVLRNPTGAACGIDATSGGMRVVCLPGFPKEMIAMFELHVLPTISPEPVVEREFKVKLRETKLEPIFQLLAKEYGVRVASLPKEDWKSGGNVVVLKGDEEMVEAAAKRFLELVVEKKDEDLD